MCLVSAGRCVHEEGRIGVHGACTVDARWMREVSFYKRILNERF